MATTTALPQIPGYRLVKVEGKGAVGTVYRARSEKTDSLAAVKRISRQLTAHSTFVSYLQDGVQRLSRVAHPNLARPIQLGCVGESYFAVTEFVEGECLRDRLRQTGRLPETEARHYVLQAARGLNQAHRAGALHYDLKPSNILLSEDDELKVADFWYNFHRYVGSVPEEQLYELMEFPLYMSPEERKDNTLTVRSNVFSLGAIFHHLVFGKPLLDVHGERMPPPELPGNVTVSEETRQVIRRMTEEAPEGRFADFAEVIGALGDSSLAKLDLAAVGLYGGVVLAVLLTVLIFFRGAWEARKPDSQAPARDENRAANNVLAAVESGPDAQLREIEAFLFQRPDQADEAIRRFEEIGRAHQGTLWETSAQERVLALKEQRAARENERWAKLEQDLERLCKQESFGEALGLLREFSGSCADKGLKEKADSAAEDVRKRERESYGALRGRVAAAVAKQDYERARKELEFALKHFTSPVIMDSAKTELALVRQLTGSTQAAKPDEFQFDAAAENESFRKFVDQAFRSLAEFRYLHAEHICRQAAVKFRDEEMRSFARTFTDVIPEDQRFVNALFERINSRKAQPPTICARDKQKLRVYCADWEGVTVQASGGEKWGWKQFDPAEIFRMLDQNIDRQSGAEQLGMGRFCYLRGLWSTMSQKLKLAVAFDPALSTGAKSLSLSDRLTALLEQGD